MKNEDNISIAEFRATLAKQIERCKAAKRPLVITSHGKAEAVVLSYEQYLGLINQTEQTIELNLASWKKNKKARQKVASSIADLFITENLSRKGQKEYKKNAVRKLQKSSGKCKSRKKS